MVEYRIEQTNNGASVYTPYNPDFVTRVKALGGRWDATHKAWTISLDRIEEVRVAMRAIYGRDDVEPADLRIVTLRAVDEAREPKEVTAFGRTIARAYSRDSGARPGDGAHFLEGFPKSGGSRAHWDCIIPEGCVIRVDDVPAALLEDLPRWAEIVSNIPAAVDVDALRQERDRLMARIQEIDQILAAL